MHGKKQYADELFGSSSKGTGKMEERKNILKTPMESMTDFKRRRDDTTESMRKKNREEKFKSRRMGDDAEIFQAVQPQEPTPKEIISLLAATALKFRENDKAKNLEALRIIRQLLSYKAFTPIQEAVDMGLVPILLHFASQEADVEMQVVCVVTK
eukprot:TRINITY_DN5797_c0_g1_i31.p1 TRINITY_DN5797_c0_g1~~TRINITY_DN5797_c0_g1_i31.p1  ORF type:complete len:155 (+),score=40.44 TRINITY_DN5797_c0_g1_i31:186-650(+)